MTTKKNQKMKKNKTKKKKQTLYLIYDKDCYNDPEIYTTMSQLIERIEDLPTDELDKLEVATVKVDKRYKPKIALELKTK